MKKTAGYYVKQEVEERGGKAIVAHTNDVELVAISDPDRGTYILNCETGEEAPHDFEDFDDRSKVLSELYDFFQASTAEDAPQFVKQLEEAIESKIRDRDSHVMLIRHWIERYNKRVTDPELNIDLMTQADLVRSLARDIDREEQIIESIRRTINAYQDAYFMATGNIYCPKEA